MEQPLLFDTMNENHLFRLAAVLYADNNYEVAPKTILKKVIESALVSQENKPINVHQLIELIYTAYNLHLDEEEVLEIINANKDDAFFTNEKNGECIIALTERRRQIIESKITNKTIDYFILEFERLNTTLVTGSNSKDIIYKFLYEIVTTNIGSFKKLLHAQKTIDDLINVETKSYTPIEREIINTFLIWDNNEKNKAIFDIASYALEYCLISNNSKGSHLQMSSLKNKCFYLDTNVIFRALGINGINRQNRTRTFLQKFIETKSSLVISKFSEQEFKDTISVYIKKLKNYRLSGQINPAIFKEKYFKGMSSVYDFYYQWRFGRSNDSLELFESHIMSLYDKFKKDYKIETDYRLPFNDEDQKIIDTVQELSSSIGTFKNIDGGRIRVNGDRSDAFNILLVESKRDGKNANIFETKFYIVSTDQYLRKWDYSRNKLTPIVILPSQWLSILLRYITRTDDDYKSFVSFLNLPTTETQIDSDKLHIILSGISEMTQNFEQQQFLVQNLVDKQFKGILEKNIQSEEILERSKTFAKTELERRIDEINSQQANLSEEFDEHKRITNDEIARLKTSSQNKDQELVEKHTQLDKLKKELQENYVNGVIKRWRATGYASLFLAVLIFFFYLLEFFFVEWKHNFVQALLKYVDNDPSEMRRNFSGSLNMGLGTVLLFSLGLSYRRLISKNVREEKTKSIINNLPEKYR